jgi:eukaryotic-like serine/threonine-protein kinase
VIGTVLKSRYEVTGLLIDGPIFSTYSGRDRQSGRDVSVRILKAPYSRDSVFIDELRATIKRYQTVQGPNVERLFDVEVDDRTTFIVGELTRCPSLEDRIRKLAPFTTQVAISTVLSLCRALEEAHRAKIAHGDLNPANLAVLADGDIRLQLTGMWEAYSGSSTAASVILPSMSPYLAPEVSSGAMPSPTTDVYAVGVILFELLTGRKPFVGDSPIAIAIQHATAQTPSVRAANPSVPPAIDEVVRKALSKTPSSRYASAVELSRDLKIIQDSLRFGRQAKWPISGDLPPESREERQPEPSPRRSRTKSTVRPATTGSQRVAPRMSAIRSEEEYEDQPRKESRERDVPVWALLMLTFLFAIAATGVGLFVLDNLHKPRLVAAPNLKGLSVSEARTVLVGAKLKLRVGGREPDDRIEMDHVLSSDREPGDKIPEGGVVTVVVSSGSRTISVPVLKNLTPDKAKALLATMSLFLDPTYDHAPDPNVPSGLIVRSTPEARSLVNRESRVHIILSTGNMGGGESNVSSVPTGDPTIPDSGTSGSGSKSNRYTLHMHLIDLDKPTRVKVEIADDHGTRVIEDLNREPGERFDVLTNGFGSEVTFRFYYDGTLVKTLTQKPPDQNQVQTPDSPHGKPSEQTP